MSGRLRAGVVGTGFIGAVHARSIHASGAQLVAVAASTPERGRAAADRLGATRAAATGLELVQSDDIDVVHIATPNDLHCSLTIAALESGKHVVCEKPLAMSAGDAETMHARAVQLGLIGAVPFVNRFHPMAREARTRVRGGEHGIVQTIHGSYLQDWLLDPAETNWRVDPDKGGSSRAFADIGSHWCDLAEWITGESIVEVAATTSTTVSHRPVADRPTFSSGPAADGSPRTPVETEDVAAVIFRTASGVAGSLMISQVAPGRKNRLWIEVDGDQRSVVFNQEAAEQLWLGGQHGTQIVTRDPATLSDDARRYAVLPPGHTQGFHDCFDAFVRDVYDSIHQGAPVQGLPTFADGVRSMRLVEAVLTSATKHSWIEV